jgi:hypothetical protein
MDTEPTKLNVDVKVGTERFLLNASPSTLAALLGSVECLEPLWKGTDDDMEMNSELVKLKRQTVSEEELVGFTLQREELLRIFRTVDVDNSGTLKKDQLEKVVKMMFDEEGFGTVTSQLVGGAHGLTTEELKREQNFFMSLVDSGRSNEVIFPELDSVLFRIANKIDDCNLTSKVKTGVVYLDNFSKSNSFLSGPLLRRLIYYDDLREYASLHEVYRITGYTRLDGKSPFPAPSLWRQGEGIDLFWELYTRETGCTRTSLNGQDISAVQRKLVRSLW